DGALQVVFGEFHDGAARGAVLAWAKDAEGLHGGKGSGWMVTVQARMIGGPSRWRKVRGAAAGRPQAHLVEAERKQQATGCLHCPAALGSITPTPPNRAESMKTITASIFRTDP